MGLAHDRWFSRQPSDAIGSSWLHPLRQLGNFADFVLQPRPEPAPEFPLGWPWLIHQMDPARVGRRREQDHDLPFVGTRPQISDRPKVGLSPYPSAGNSRFGPALSLDRAE